MKFVKALCAVLLVVVLALPVSVIAKDTDKAGQVTTVSGQAEVKKSGGSKKFKAFKGMAITKGDTIITGKDGKVVMDLDSDKEVTIGSSTTLTVSELVKNAKALGGKTSLSLLEGKVSIKIKKKLDGDSRFEIETPTAIMGVMGTEFFVQYENNESYVGVFTGLVSALHGPGMREPSIIKPDEQLKLNQEGKGEVEKLQPEQMPLIALEHYMQLVQQRKDAEQALKDQIKQLLEKKRQEAAAEANQSEAAPANKTIIYSDANTGGSGQTTEEESPVVTPVDPTVTGAPELDREAFENDIYSYIINDRTIILPFKQELAFNIDPSGGEQAVDWNEFVNVEFFTDGGGFECEWRETEGGGGEEVCEQPRVENLALDGRMLKIELAEEHPIPFYSLVVVSVNGNLLKNKQTGEAQEDPEDIGIEFFFGEPDPSWISYYTNTEDFSDLKEIIIPTFGYALESPQLHAYPYYIEGEPDSSAEVPFNPGEQYTMAPDGNNKWRMTLDESFLRGLRPGGYEILFWLSNGHVLSVWINVMVPENPDFPGV